MPDLDPAVEAAARALVVDKLGFLAPSRNDEFREECRRVAEVAVTAVAPLIRAQEREATEDRLSAVDIEISTASPLHDLWCAAVDAANSPDFRLPPGQRCPVCDHAIGDLDEALYLRRQRGAIEAAEARVRAQERAAVRAELLELAVQYEGVHGAGWRTHAQLTRNLANRIAPEHTTPREKP